MRGGGVNFREVGSVDGWLPRGRYSMLGWLLSPVLAFLYGLAVHPAGEDAPVDDADVDLPSGTDYLSDFRFPDGMRFLAAKVEGTLVVGLLPGLPPYF